MNDKAPNTNKTDVILDIIFSWPSVWVHVVWFTTWWFFPIPNKLSLLTNVVSLEAILITLFVGISTVQTSDSIHKIHIHLLPHKKGEKSVDIGNVTISADKE